MASCHIATYGAHVNLGFNRGAALPDPNRMLAGTGKAIRHIAIRCQDDLERPALRRFVRAAIEQVAREPRPVARRCSSSATARGRVR